MSTALLGLPGRRHRPEHPFWHRPAPAVAVVRLDPGYASLRSALPRAWESLVRVKYTLDALTAVARTPGPRRWSGGPFAMPFLDALAEDLEEVATAAPGLLLGHQAAEAAQATRAYRSTGTWPVTVLDQPVADQPWMHCGPLRPWATQESPQPLALFVGRPEASAQGSIDAVSEARPILEATVAEALGSAIPADRVIPEMLALDLLLVGGTAVCGHKNFAHFFPLEAPSGRTLENDFTVVFCDVHLERLVRCSLPLLAALSSRPIDIDPGTVARASLGWFRVHDMAHFWATDDVGRPGMADTRSFEEMVLREALSDAIGVLGLAEVEDPAALGVAFSAEMLRYLSRNHHEFADTTAAALEAGWLATEGHLEWGDPAHWLESARPSMARLARALRVVLDGSPGPVPALRRALEAGRHLVADWYGPLAHLPTDLEYSFG